MQTRTIARFPGYRFRASGTILGRRGKSRRQGIATRPETHYQTVRLVDADGVRQEARCADLICEAFHGPRPEGAVVHFTDGNEYNWSAGNVSWERVARPAGLNAGPEPGDDWEDRDLALFLDREGLDRATIADLAGITPDAVDQILIDE